MHGDVLDSWIDNLTTYLQTYPKMSNEQHILLANNHLEGIAQAWWYSQQTSTKIHMQRNEKKYVSEYLTNIATWDALWQALRRHVYPPSYLSNLVCKWL